MAKRQISAKAFLKDFREGMGEAQLMEKYKISTRGLQKIFHKLVEAGAISKAEFAPRLSAYEDTVTLDVRNVRLSPEATLEFRPKSPYAPKDAGYTEVGWSVTTKGTLSQLTNLLYLIDAEPYLHKADGVSVTPVDARTGLATLSFKYSTLAIRSRTGEKLATTRPATDAAAAPLGISLNSPERQQYAAIATRDLFRPYVKRQPRPVRPPSRRTTAAVR